MPDETKKFEYSIGNALLWGNCLKNFQKANNESISGGHRFAYGLLGFAQILPVISQLVSLAEWGIYSAYKTFQAKPADQMPEPAKTVSYKVEDYASGKLLMPSEPNPTSTPHTTENSTIPLPNIPSTISPITPPPVTPPLPENWLDNHPIPKLAAIYQENREGILQHIREIFKNINENYQIEQSPNGGFQVSFHFKDDAELQKALDALPESPTQDEDNIKLVDQNHHILTLRDNYVQFLTGLTNNANFNDAMKALNVRNWVSNNPNLPLVEKSYQENRGEIIRNVQHIFSCISLNYQVVKDTYGFDQVKFNFNNALDLENAKNALSILIISPWNFNFSGLVDEKNLVLTLPGYPLSLLSGLENGSENLADLMIALHLSKLKENGNPNWQILEKGSYKDNKTQILNNIKDTFSSIGSSYTIGINERGKYCVKFKFNNEAQLKNVQSAFGEFFSKTPEEMNAPWRLKEPLTFELGSGETFALAGFGRSRLDAEFDDAMQTLSGKTLSPAATQSPVPQPPPSLPLEAPMETPPSADSTVATPSNTMEILNSLKLPKCEHYEKFNKDPVYKQKATAIRAAMKETLDKQFQRKGEKGDYVGWSLGRPIHSLQDNEVIKMSDTFF